MGRAAEKIGDHQRLRSGHAGADFDPDMTQADTTVSAEFDTGHRRFGTGAEVFLADGETNAIPVIRVCGFALLLDRVAVFPHVVRSGLVENFVQAQRTGRDRALGVLHARTQCVLAPQLNGIHTQAPGDFVDHHFGRRHALQGAVATHRTGFNATGVVRGDLQVVLRHVVDRLRRRGADRSHRWAVVDPATAVDAHVGEEDFEAVVVFVDRQLIADIERVALDAALELLVTVIGQTHRHTSAIQRSEGGVVDENIVVFGTVTHGVTRVHVQMGQAEARRRDHLGGLGRHFQWALGGHHKVQGLGRRIVPTVAVVRLHGGRFDRWGFVALVKHQPVVRRRVDLALHALGVEQPALSQVAVQAGLGIPHRATVFQHREQDRILEAGEFVFVGRGRASHAHVTEAAVGVTFVIRHFGTVTNRLVIELELVLGLTETLEVVPDQDRHRVTDEHRHFALGQQRVRRMFFREDDTVLVQVGSGDDTVRLQLGAKPRQVVACVDVVGLDGFEQHGVALLLGPARHVLGSNVAGKHLAAADFRQGIVTLARLAVMAEPLFRRHGHAVFHQGSQRLGAERRERDTHTRHQPALEERAPGYFTVGHGSSSERL